MAKVITPAQALAYLERWKLVAAAEQHELVSVPMTTKLQQLGVLMASRSLFPDDPDRERQTLETRKRWDDIRRVLGG